jgi:hypothetical protein
VTLQTVDAQEAGCLMHIAGSARMALSMTVIILKATRLGRVPVRILVANTSSIILIK